MSKKTVTILKIITLICIIALCVIIFVFSSMNGDESSNISGKILEKQLRIFFPDFENYEPAEKIAITEFVHMIIRKAAHFSIYGLLGFFTVTFSFLSDRRQFKMYSYPALFCVLYAVSDEVHQLFVVNRSGSVIDVIIDFAGSICGMLIFSLLGFLIKRKLRGKL